MKSICYISEDQSKKKLSVPLFWGNTRYSNVFDIQECPFFILFLKNIFFPICTPFLRLSGLADNRDATFQEISWNQEISK